jgi:hypothetical protein
MLGMAGIAKAVDSLALGMFDPIAITAPLAKAFDTSSIAQGLGEALSPRIGSILSLQQEALSPFMHAQRMNLDILNYLAN